MMTILIYVLLLPFCTLVLKSQTRTYEDVMRDAAEKQIKVSGLSEAQLSKLKAAGIDVRRTLQRELKPTEMTEAALSDLVVIGEVLKQVDIPGSENGPFRSTVLVQVTQLLKGDLQGSRVIELLRQSGPTGGGNRITVSIDAVFKPGETVLLFLQKPEKNSYLTAVYKKLFEEGKVKTAKNQYWAGASKYSVKDGKVVFLREERNVDDIVRNVMRVDSILQAR